jgi:hypothetical protein
VCEKDRDRKLNGVLWSKWLSYKKCQFVVTAVNMVNGISVNGLGEVAMDTSQAASNLIGLGKQLSHELLLGRNLHCFMTFYTDGTSINSEMVHANYHCNLLLPNNITYRSESFDLLEPSGLVQGLLYENCL